MLLYNVCVMCVYLQVANIVYTPTHGADFPENHSIRPHVSLCSEMSVEQSLDGHPAQWEGPVRSRDVHLIGWEES